MGYRINIIFCHRHRQNQFHYFKEPWKKKLNTKISLFYTFQSHTFLFPILQLHPVTQNHPRILFREFSWQKFSQLILLLHPLEWTLSITFIQLNRVWSRKARAGAARVWNGGIRARGRSYARGSNRDRGSAEFWGLFPMFGALSLSLSRNQGGTWDCCETGFTSRFSRLPPAAARWNPSWIRLRPRPKTASLYKWIKLAEEREWERVRKQSEKGKALEASMVKSS